MKHSTYAQSQNYFKALPVKYLIHVLFWRASEGVHMKSVHTF